MSTIIGNALNAIERVARNDCIPATMRYCFHKAKTPYVSLTQLARPNCVADFLLLGDLDRSIAPQFDGIGFSIQASNVCSIDVDHCFSEAFNPESINQTGEEIYSMFCDLTYVEFSFSGTGLRLIFEADPIPDYSEHYKTKNSNNHIEFYYPEGSARYLTITGIQLNRTSVKKVATSVLKDFLDKYMRKPEKSRETPENAFSEDVGDSERLKHCLRTDMSFQNNWFEKAPGSGKNESERDYYMVKYLYDNVSKDKRTVRAMFESSPFFASKDAKHRRKWEYGNNRYFNYLWECITNL